MLSVYDKACFYLILVKHVKIYFKVTLGYPVLLKFSLKAKTTQIVFKIIQYTPVYGSTMETGQWNYRRHNTFQLFFNENIPNKRFTAII